MILEATNINWWEEEFDSIDFGDKRLKKRLMKTADQLSTQPLDPINKACSCWADTKASYRMFANDKVKSTEIIRAHRDRTWERAKQYTFILAIQDTSFINYTSHPATVGLGDIGSDHRSKGICQHTSLAMSPDGVALGVLDQQIWTRQNRPKGSRRKTKINRAAPIAQKESNRWLRSLDAVMDSAPKEVQVVTIADRECDIYEFIAHAEQRDALFLIRASMDRAIYTAENESEVSHLWDYLESQPKVGEVQVDVPAKGTKKPARIARLAVRFAQVEVKRPRRGRFNKKSKIEKSVFVHAILLQEINPSKRVTPLEWMLLTNTVVTTFEEAIEKMNWYRLRWGIEVYHKVLKSGCKIEECRLGTADRLTRYLALFAIIAWRLHWMTYLNRERPDSKCESILAEYEWKALYCKIHKTSTPPEVVPTTRQAVRWIAQLGGFLARAGDGEPGIITIWRGWQRLTDIAEDWLLFKSPSS